MGFVKQMGVADIPAFFTFLKTQLALHGWTVHDINTDVAEPPDLTTGLEFLAISNGKTPGSGDPANHVIGLSWINVFSAAANVQFWGAAGIRGPVDIDQVTYSGTTATVQTAAPHPFRDGDVIHFGGLDIQGHNRVTGGDAWNPNKATLVGSPGVSVAWTQSMADAGGAGTSVGGKAWATYNQCGYRTTANNLNNQIYLLNSPMDVWIHVDEFYICGIIGQSGGYFTFFMGRPGRESVQSEASGAGKITNGPIVSDGISASVIQLDRSISGKMYVGAPVQAYNPNDATPETDGVHFTQVAPFAITAVNSGTEVEAVLPAGTWQNGAILGMDAANVVTSASRTINAALPAVPYYPAFGFGGEKVNFGSPSHTPRVRTSNSEEVASDPDGASQYHGNPIALFGDTGPRKYLPGFIGVARGVQNNADLMIGGDPANSPAKDYVIFPTLDVDGYAIAFGPGAS